MSALALAAAAATLGIAGSASATEWIGTPATLKPFEDPANWAGGAVPTGDAAINNGGIAGISTFSGSVDRVLAGATTGGSGTVVQSGGSVSTGDDILIGGDNAGGTGTGAYNISAGSISTGFDFQVGYNGPGSFNMSGGSLNTGRFFGLGYRAGATATATQTGGTIFATNAFTMSNALVSDGPPATYGNSTSSYTMDGATASIDAADVFIGAQGTATFTLNNGLLKSRSHIRIGDNADYPNLNAAFRSNGTLNVNGGTVNLDSAGGGNHILIGHVGTGVLNMTGGTIITDRINLGQHGQNIYPAADPTKHARGILNQTGGLIVIDAGMVVGEQSLNDNQVNISAGTLRFRNATSNNVTMTLGSSGGRGTLNASAAANIELDAHIFAGSGATSIGAVNISGASTIELGKNIRFTTPGLTNLLSGGFLVVGEFGTATANISGGDTKMHFMQHGRRNNTTSRGQTTQTGGAMTVARSITIGGLSPNDNFYDISAGTLTQTGVLENPTTPPKPPEFVGDDAAWATAYRNAVNMNDLEPGIHVARNSTGDPAAGPIVPSKGRLTISGTAAVSLAYGLYNSTGATIQPAGSPPPPTTKGPGGIGLIEMKGGTLAAAFFSNGSVGNPGTLASANYVQTGGTATLGHVTGTGNVSVSGGTMNVNSLRQASASLSGNGVVKVAPNSSSAGTSVVATLAITGNAKLDLGANKLITNTAPGTATAGVYNGVQGMVQRAYDFNAWDQPGLTTSQADAVAGLTTIGVATGAQMRGLGPTDTDTFSGQTITGASTIAMYTYAGDANLDGVIDGGDYGTIDNFVQVPGADGYANGDFNYDGVINGGDYGVIDNNIQAQGPGFPTSGSASASLSGVTAVPEPASLSVIALGAAGLFGRRRRRAAN
jgi:hypothetical protein